MLLCANKTNCTCLHHKLIEWIKKHKNNEAKTMLPYLENVHELANNKGTTLLHTATQFGNAEITKILIEKRCNVNAKNSIGLTPLMSVVMKGDVATGKILLENNANIYDSDAKGTSILLHACNRFFSHTYFSQNNHHSMLEMLINKIDEDFLKEPDMAKNYLIEQNDLVKLVLVSCGNIELVKFILTNGYDTNYQETVKSMTALNCAIITSKFNNAKILIEYGANVDILDEYKKSPFRYYAWGFEQVDQQSEVLLAFLKVSSKLTVPDKRGVTDLEVLLNEGREETVRVILTSSINVHTNFHDGRSLIHVLVENENYVLDVLEDLEFQFDVNAQKSNGETALMAAVLCGHMKKVEFLLNHGADVNIIKADGNSALCFTVLTNGCGTRHLEDREAIWLNILLYLLQSGADAQLVFESERIRDFFYYHTTKSHFIGVVTAHLAMVEILDDSFLAEKTRELIESKESLEEYFDLCTEQLEMIKNGKPFYGTITLFDILTEKEEKKLVAYARNLDLIVAFDNEMARMPDLKYYYAEVMYQRMVKAKNKADIIENAALAIKELTGLCNVVAYEIIDYLKDQDICNLNQFYDEFFVV